MFGANLHIRASLLKYEGRREMVPAGLREPPNGRGGVRCGFDSGFPRRGCRRHRAARTHLTCSSFRAFRSATRCPGSCRGLYQTRQKAVGVPIGADAHIGPLPRLPSTTGQRQRKEKQFNATTTPTPSAPSATGRQLQKSQKTLACPTARQNRRLHRYADPRTRGGPLHRSAPKRLFLFHRARRILFLGKAKKRMGGAPLWEQPLAGARHPQGRRPAAHQSPQGPRPSKISSICENKIPLKLL